MNQLYNPPNLIPRPQKCYTTRPWKMSLDRSTPDVPQALSRNPPLARFPIDHPRALHDQLRGID